MVHNLVHNLCESLVTNIGGVAGIGKKTPPTPITYLTQWKIVGNSQVHTDTYLTSWKVSGNSVVDNNTILSCGDLGQDGMYHVKISNGVTVYDIPLDAPLRKVNDVTDTIEFANGVAIVTRYFEADLVKNLSWFMTDIANGKKRVATTSVINKIKRLNTAYDVGNILCSEYNTISPDTQYGGVKGISSNTLGYIFIYDADYDLSGGSSAFVSAMGDLEIIYELATPTTETIQVPDIAVSPTDTYTSANVTPYSAFEHTEHKEIWSCGEPIMKSLTLFDSTYELLKGWLPMSGAYPTINKSQPNAKYYIFDVKAGYTITTNITSNIRLRLIDNGIIVSNINLGINNDYVTSTYDPVNSTTGYVIVKKDCQIGLLVLDSTESYAGSVVASYIKYHILVQPLGGSIADIALDEPLRKVNNVADTIEFANNAAVVTRHFGSEDMGDMSWNNNTIDSSSKYRCTSQLLIDVIKRPSSLENIANILTIFYSTTSLVNIMRATKGIGVSTQGVVSVYDENYNQSDSAAAFAIAMQGAELIYELATPTTETIQVPQIQEADSYTCVISQGGKAVEWTEFVANPT